MATKKAAAKIANIAAYQLEDVKEDSTLTIDVTIQNVGGGDDLEAGTLKITKSNGAGTLTLQQGDGYSGEGESASVEAIKKGASAKVTWEYACTSGDNATGLDFSLDYQAGEIHETKACDHIEVAATE